MAGIGFTLRKALGRNVTGKYLRVYGSAAFVVAGPWLVTMIGLCILYFWGNRFGMLKEQWELFFGTVTYATLVSSMISNIVQLLITRYLADALYVKGHDRLLSGFSGIFIYSGALALFVGTISQLFLPLSFPYRVWAVMLTVIMTMLWLLMILLSAAKAYGDIARSFLVGLFFLIIVTLVLGVWIQKGGQMPNTTSILALYTIAQGITLLWVGAVAIRDFPGQMPTLYNVSLQYKHYPQLLWIGLFYGLTMCIDNGVYWFSNIQVKIADSFLLAPPYDLAKFFTILAFIPTFIVFSISIETDFYQIYRRFFDSIDRGDGLEEILVYEDKLRTQAKAMLFRIAKVQTATVVFAWVVARQFSAQLPKVVEIFNWTIVGSIAHVITITVFLLLLYFDSRKRALWLMGLGLMSLFLSTEVAKQLDWWPGTGYFVGTTLMLLIGLFFLNRHLKKLLYYSFHDPNSRTANQPPPGTHLTSRQLKKGFPVIREYHSPETKKNDDGITN